MRVSFMGNFLKVESLSGILLLVAALLALLLDNSALAGFYRQVFQAPLFLPFSSRPFLFWINEGLMTFFFLLVGLELKREFLQGELSAFKQVLLPGFCALGGMLCPALIYIAINFTHPVLIKGWAIPVATDIAFALGVLSFFGKRIPLGLKVFLMALAILDDLGAIILIALFFHTGPVSWVALAAVLGGVLFLAILNRCRVQLLWPFFIVGIFLWLALLQSGIHPTLAGVLLAFFIPLQNKKLENSLHPWVAFGVMPLFALANSGISFTGVTLSALFNPMTLGIIAGLFLGKQLGVCTFAWLIIKKGWAALPPKTSWGQFYGVALLCGIGFTMSLFLGTLAFEKEDSMYLLDLRLGVFLGSVLSGIAGAIVLKIVSRRSDNP